MKFSHDRLAGIAFCLIILAGLAVSASAADQDLARGLQAMKAKHYQEAETDFARSLSRDPRQADVLLLVGIARYHQHRFAPAITSLQTALSQQTKYPARALYYLGLCQSESGLHRESRATFVRLHAEYPTSKESALLERSRPNGRLSQTGPQTVAAVSPWSLRMSLSGGYDTNPTRSPDVPSTGSSASAGDYFGGGKVFASAPLGSTSLLIYGEMFGRIYAKTAAYNVFDIRGGLEAPWRIGDSTNVVADASVSHIWLDTTSYETRERLSLSWRQAWTGAWRTAIRPYITFQQHPQPFQFRDGTIIGVDATARWRLDHAPLRWIEVYGSAERYDASTMYFGWSQALIDLEFSSTRISGWGIDLYGSVRERRYAAFDPNLGVDRADQRFEEGLDLSKSVSDHIRLHLDATVLQNHSNADRYRYREGLVSGRVEVHF